MTQASPPAPPVNLKAAPSTPTAVETEYEDTTRVSKTGFDPLAPIPFFGLVVLPLLIVLLLMIANT